MLWVTLRQMQGIDAARERVADACRRLASAGLVIGTGGNVSERCDDRVAISPSGAELGALSAEDVTIVDLDGSVVDGDRPSSELELHLGIYRRFGTAAVVHTHAPTSTALSCVVGEVPCIHYQMILLGGAVPVAPYATFGSPELAAVTLDALEGKLAALMAHHGAIVHAPDLDRALQLAELLEWACTVYLRAASVGRPRVLDDAQCDAVIAAAVERGYGA
jgi:L-fuculose-phosphate aldolase